MCYVGVSSATTELKVTELSVFESDRLIRAYALHARERVYCKVHILSFERARQERSSAPPEGAVVKDKEKKQLT